MVMVMMSSGSRGGSSCGGRGDGVAFGVAELAELGGDVPNGEAGVGIEDGVDVPGGLAGGDGDEGVVAGLPPGPDILAALLVGPPQGVGALLVQAVQGVAIMIRQDRSLTIDLLHREESNRGNHSRNCGKITVHAEESASSKTTIEMILSCSDLEYKDLFSRSDPFLVISKIVEGGAVIPVCKTEVIKNELKPKWNPIFLSIQQVGSKDQGLIIECFNFNSNGKHDLIGKVEKSLADLEKLHRSKQVENLFIPSSVGHGHPLETKVLKSCLFVDKFTESVQHTFLDYLAGGFELNFMVAIDFTVFVASYSVERLAELYVSKIVAWHGLSESIISDRDGRFMSRFWKSVHDTSRFWKNVHDAMRSKLKFSTAFHPQTDGQSERTIQTLENMLRACVMDFTGNWDRKLPLIEFSYNNSYHTSIGMAPFKALYGRKCRSPIHWYVPGEKHLETVDFTRRTTEDVRLIRERLDMLG
ncbi:Protein BONZAI 2 [Morus notabilis]|uniref:Protein BONZAI 2 n=1 Tax=Morus notabilis TaxID=981085 RepID=W9RS23_9ROSA|nr:Protein BONZAI 2 [Morus notabilis]